MSPLQRIRVVAISLLAVTSLHCGGGPSAPPPVPIPTLLITCPTAAPAQSMDNQPVAVSFPLPVASGGASPVTTGCSPASGNTFPVGQTAVTCNATDAKGTVAMCTFTVTVHPPPRMTATRFVAFGDSLTFGVDSPPLRTAGPSFAYPEQLRQRLAARYREQFFTVENEGLPGEYAQEAVGRLINVIRSRRPEVVLLMEGSNDLLQFEAGMERAITALRAMVAFARSENVKVALATIPPQRPGGPRMRPAATLVATFNDRVRALAVSENVPLIDVYGGMKDNLSLIGEDDLHPTIQGFSVMADIFDAGVRQHFEEKFTAVASARR